MKPGTIPSIITFCLTVLGSLMGTAQVQTESFLFGDALPTAPELSWRGEYKVGVRTIELINKNQVDVLNSKDGVDPRYDRQLTVEVWYPAIIPDGEKELVMYHQVMGRSNNPERPLIPFTFNGRALRDATPLVGSGPYPLIIISHGYPGSRLIFTYLTENLASKGYVVVSIDHKESTFRDLAGFPSTLLNRSIDQLFVLNQIAALSKTGSSSFLSGLADANNTGLVGYSMGGYGVLNVAGAGYSTQLTTLFSSLTGGSKAIEVRTTNHPAYKGSTDKRIKAVVAFAPWGMERGVWDSEGLKGLTVPTFFIAGNQDDVSGYENGIKAIYSGAIHADRYLLTYDNARHNTAPNPPPAESLMPHLIDEYNFYAEPAWNEYHINNINQHFVTAFLGILLKKKDYTKYLNLNENSNEKNWTGFKPRTSVGLELLHALPVKD